MRDILLFLVFQALMIGLGVLNYRLGYSDGRKCGRKYKCKE